MTTSNWHLKPEHQLLGAHLNEELGHVVDYGNQDREVESLKSGQAVVDLHGYRMLLVEGDAAEYFIQCACATQMLFVGQNAFTAIFDSDGRLLGCPLIMRTGDKEFLLFDRDVQFENVLDWFMALAEAKQQGQPLFEGISVTEKTGYLYPLVLCGPGSKIILNDYLEDAKSLEFPGMTSALKLDKIDTIASRLALEYPVYLLLVPPTYVRTLFRSFLSFKQLDTVGYETFWNFLTNGECSFLKLFKPLQQGESDNTFNLDDFKERGLVRTEPTYIGARAIEE